MTSSYKTTFLTIVLSFVIPRSMAAQDYTRTLPETSAPVVQLIHIEAQLRSARTFAFTAERQPDKFLTAFERRFGEPLEREAPTWERINYQPWGVEDVTVRMNVIQQAGDAVDVRLRIELPGGPEDHDAALEDIRIWFQRLVDATLGGEE